MKNLEKLENELEHERQLCRNHGMRKNQPTAFWFAAITKSMALISNIAIYPVKYSWVYLKTYVYSNINSDYVKRQMFESQNRDTISQDTLIGRNVEVKQK